jgi:hypothetical protein
VISYVLSVLMRLTQRYCRSSRRFDRADLRHELEHADFRPMLGNFAVAHPVDVHLGPVARCVGGWSALKRTSIGRLRGAAFDNGVIAGDEVHFRHDNVWKGRIHHPSNALETGGQWRRKIMLEIAREQMINPVYVVLVLKHAREFAYRGFISFAGHLILPLGFWSFIVCDDCIAPEPRLIKSAHK